jgi:hypothetical protein
MQQRKELSRRYSSDGIGPFEQAVCKSGKWR